MVNEVVVEISDTGIPDGVIDIVEHLPRPADVKEGTHVILRFTGRFVFTTGLTLLATWRTALPSNVLVSIDDSACTETTRRLLRNSSFNDIIAPNDEAPRLNPYQVSGRVPIQPILRENTTEQTIREICRIFDAFGGDHNTQPFRTLLSEICENAFVHSEFQTPGYISSNYHKVPNRCEVAVVDSGIGILNSYLEGTNASARERLKSGAIPIDLALEGHVSSKKESTFSHYGYGLLIVRRLVEENRGRLVIISGQDCVTIDRYQKRTRRLTNSWDGTFIGIVLEMNNPLPLDDIYAEETQRTIGSRVRTTSVTEKIIQLETSPKPTTIPNQKEKDEPAIPAAEVSPDHMVSLPSEPDTEISLIHYGAELLTREMGIAVRAEIATALLKDPGIIRVNLNDVTDITPSVADEAFGKLAEALGLEEFGRRVILAGGSPLMSRLIALVVSKRTSF